MSVRILCTGDIHLGRRPSRVPEGLDARALGPARAWEALVEKAIELPVDAAALTGDIVDESNKLYEAYSVLQKGVERLLEAGIAVFAVAGNHDYNVLPRLAGRAGRSSFSTISNEARPAAQASGCPEYV